MDELEDLNEVIEPEEDEDQEEIVLATVAEVTANGVKITIDGADQAGTKEYKANAGQLLAVGDRVKIHKNSGTYLIEYVIGAPMSKYPIPAGGSDGQVLTKDGANDYAVKWAAAHGVPSGGAAGQVLAKNSATDYDLAWITKAGLPAGGAKDQALVKTAATDYSVGWATIGHDLPTGGSAGQLLAKKTNTNYDVEWINVPHDLPTGGTTGQILKKSSNANYAVEWGAVPSPSAISNGSYTVTLSNNGILYPSSGNITLGSNNNRWNGCYFGGAMYFGSSYGSTIGFFGTTPQSKKYVGSSGTLATLITALQGYGLIS